MLVLLAFVLATGRVFVLVLLQIAVEVAGGGKQVGERLNQGYDASDVAQNAICAFLDGFVFHNALVFVWIFARASFGVQLKRARSL